MAAPHPPPHPCPYASLPHSASPHLQVVVHFTLVFRAAVQLPPAALVYPHLEFSILRARGVPYRSLTHFIATVKHRSAHRIRARLHSLPPPERVQALRQLVDDAVASGCVRSECSAQNAVAPFVRARVSLRDSQRRSYLWLRGPDELSARFLVGTRRLRVLASERHVKQHVHALSASMQRCDVVAASWLSSRFERAQHSSQAALAPSKLTAAYTSENASPKHLLCSSDQAHPASDSEAFASAPNDLEHRSLDTDTEWERTNDSQSDDDNDNAPETSDDEWLQINLFRRQKRSAPTVRGRLHVDAKPISQRTLRAERRRRVRSTDDEKSSSITKSSKSDRQMRMERRVRRALQLH